MTAARRVAGMAGMALGALGALAACTTHDAAITGTQSLQVTLVSPADGGSITNRLPDSERMVTLSVQAFGVDDQPDPTYNQELQVYVYYLGTLSPALGAAIPAATVQMVAGEGMVTLTLPTVYGPTTVWFDDGESSDPTYAAGISPTLWFRDPFIADIQTPTDLTSIGALDAAPLDNKNVTINASRYGATGRLVITSVFTQGYTLADVNCTDAAGDPPCVSQGFDYIEVFSYSAPTDQDMRFVSEGQLIDGFAGGVSEFDGLTEIGFPQTFVNSAVTVDKTREPATVLFDFNWFNPIGTPGESEINFEENEGGAIEVDNAKVCPLDSDYTTFKQWKLDPTGVASPAICGGKQLINVISTGVISADPATLVGMTIPRIVGMSRPVNDGNFNVWIIYPRSDADITLP